MKIVRCTLLEREKKKKKVDAVPKSLRSPTTSSSSMGGDVAGPQSLWVVLCYDDRAPNFCSIVRIDPLTPEMIESPPRKIYAKYTAHLKLAPGIPPLRWMFSPPASATHDLYLFPGFDRDTCEEFKPLHGATFNCSTNNLQQINQPNACTSGGFAVTVGHHIYFMAHPCWCPMSKDAVAFERYNPANQLWEPQEPFPVADMQRLGKNGVVQASAVWDDIILLKLGGREIWAYNVCYSKWYRVNVQENKASSCNNLNQCYDIDGEAFAVGNTIYALSARDDDVLLALSIEKKGAPGNFEYSCSYKSACTVTPVEQFQLRDIFNETRSLVDLGNHNVCFVRSFEYVDPVKTQRIHVTYIKLMDDGEMCVTGQCCYRVKLEHPLSQFTIGFCFSLPDCKTTALKPCETFIFDPVSATVSRQEDKIGLNPEHEAGKSVHKKENVALPKKGCSVIVINLPPDTTAIQLERRLKKFGHLKRGMIRLMRDTTGKCCCAVVKFKSRTSMRRAIKASPIRIGCCRVDIIKWRGTSSTKVASNVKSSTSTITITSTNKKRKRG